jgi:hypothetical protein
VKKTRTEIKSKEKYEIDDKLTILLSNPKKKKEKVVDIIKCIKEINENAIIYCSTKSLTETYSNILINSNIISNKSICKNLEKLIIHLEKNIDSRWIIIKALKSRIGIHHGLVPKYVQKEIINLFNKGSLDILISTTTITEGVNTSAKNLIVLQGTKGGKPLKKFDAKNIEGRAGRFRHHFTGRVIVLDKNFIDSVMSEDIGINHKNYDKNLIKDEVDLFHTKDEYISDEDKILVNKLNQMQYSRKIPDNIINMYKVIKKSDKIKIYDLISKEFSSSFEEKNKKIKLLKKMINAPEMNIDFDGFQLVLNIIKPIVKDSKLYKLIDNDAHIDKEDSRSKKYSILIYILSSYLKGGFSNLFNYNLMNGKRKINKENYRKLTVDESVRDASEFIYNTMKYQLVKYLGVFDIMLRFYAFQLTKGKRKFEKPILNKLITKLEYNAITKKGKVASDYGVPYKVIEYFDKQSSENKEEINLDSYEKDILEKIKLILDKK